MHPSIIFPPSFLPILTYHMYSFTHAYSYMAERLQKSLHCYQYFKISLITNSLKGIWIPPQQQLGFKNVAQAPHNKELLKYVTKKLLENLEKKRNSYCLQFGAAKNKIFFLIGTTDRKIVGEDQGLWRSDQEPSNIGSSLPVSILYHKTIDILYTIEYTTYYIILWDQRYSNHLFLIEVKELACKT